MVGAKKERGETKVGGDTRGGRVGEEEGERGRQKEGDGARKGGRGEREREKERVSGERGRGVWR